MGPDGFANWYDIRAQEERDHAMLMREYLQNNGESVILEAIVKPDKEFGGIGGTLKHSLEREQYVTDSIGFTGRS